ncbi:hypothetical protein RclHR1_01740015 [Rhizophagus clarus]|uniref:Carbohydrate-binding module family 13 protein n=1 Tax=Rhizophagus clarus TaxID=94130 RepID=A0A2Z6RD50_9GLOM|nr:hypothetical protein RclHR1_01740015 [Rhizophagus clarus]GET02783.1 carbohydrate-binding module family 13 protein [Rhizophagus clarus]
MASNSLTYIELLAEDLTKLLTEEDDNYDVIMIVGKDDDNETFKIHSSVLSVRTPYFKMAFSNRWKKTEGDKIKLEKPNIRPKIFKVILRYVYSGVLKLNELTAKDILDLLVALDELCINNIIDDVQNYLLNNNSNWISQNFVYYHQIIFQHEAFTKLQNDWNNTVCREPILLFYSEDFPDFDESSLIEILKMDEFGIEEVNIWKNIIRWGIAKDTLDFPPSVADWSDENFNSLKETLKNLVHLIRFYTISPQDFYQHVKPYEKLLDKEHYDDILQSHLNQDWRPSVRPVLPKRLSPQRSIESEIINKQQAAIIASWIDKLEPKLGFFATIKTRRGEFNNFYENVQSYMYKTFENPYDFLESNNNNYYNNNNGVELLTIYMCSNSNRIIGEYKEINVTRMNQKLRFGPTTNSFLFSLKINSITNSIISRLKLSHIFSDNICHRVDFGRVKFIDYDPNKKIISLNSKNIFDIRYSDIFQGGENIKVDQTETIRIVRRNPATEN